MKFGMQFHRTTFWRCDLIPVLRFWYSKENLSFLTDYDGDVVSVDVHFGWLFWEVVLETEYRL
jgi:hypothetical protein